MTVEQEPAPIWATANPTTPPSSVQITCRDGSTFHTNPANQDDTLFSEEP